MSDLMIATSDPYFWKIFMMTTYNLYMAALCGNPTERQRQVYDFMRAEPRMGDLVMETSTIHRPHHHENRFGRLIGCVEETCPDLDEDELRDCERRGETVATERIWYLATPDGRMVRWHNADFIRVPERFIG